MPTRYLNFIALDAGRIDPTNSKSIIEYNQAGQGLTTEEKIAAARWFLMEICKGQNQPKPMVIPPNPKGFREEDLRNVNLPDKTVQLSEEYPAEPSRALKIYNYLQGKMKHDPETNAKVFEVLRKLKKINPGDTYLEAYEGHFQRNGDTFLDYYHTLHELAKKFEFKNVMEIGCRTGISICQLLSALKDNGKPMPKTVDLFDLFNDGFVTPALVQLNIKSLGLDLQPRVFPGDSKQTVRRVIDTKNYDGNYDYILVDGDHSREGAYADICNVEPLLAEGGIIIFDDISTAPGECGLIDVWNEFKKSREDKYYWLESMNAKGFGICVRR